MPIRVDMAETLEAFKNPFRPRVKRLEPKDYRSDLYPQKSSASILIIWLSSGGIRA